MEKSELSKAIETYKDRIYAVAFHYFRNAADADDIVGEVFLKLCQSTKQFESEEHLRNWLIRVAVNQCKKVSVSSWFRRRASLEEYAEELRYETPEESQVFLAVMSLPKKYRVVIHLYYYENYPVKEIARILEIRETTVTTRLMRGRQQLKIKLSEVWEEEQN